MGNDISNNVGTDLTGAGDFAKLDMALVEETVLSWLESKYSETFFLDLLVCEFDGDSIYYRAVFHTETRPEKGVLYCRADGDGVSVQIDGVDCFLTDDYANIILQEQYAAILLSELGEDVLVKCRLETAEGMVPDADFAAGVNTCLENAAIEPHMYVIIVADASKKGSGLQEAAQDILGRLNVYRQYLYVGYQSQMDLNDWERQYLANNDEFERYLVDQSDIEYVQFSSFHLDEGMVKNSVLKE